MKVKEEVDQAILDILMAHFDEYPGGVLDAHRQIKELVDDYVTFRADERYSDGYNDGYSIAYLDHKQR